MVYRRLFKQGNSLVFSVPGYMLDKAGVGRGDYFMIEQRNDGVIVLTGATAQSVAAIARQELERQEARSAPGAATE